MHRRTFLPDSANLAISLQRSSRSMADRAAREAARDERIARDREILALNRPVKRGFWGRVWDWFRRLWNRAGDRSTILRNDRQ